MKQRKYLNDLSSRFTSDDSRKTRKSKNFISKVFKIIKVFIACISINAFYSENISWKHIRLDQINLNHVRRD